MKNKPYLMVGERKVTLEELCCLLFSPDSKPEEIDEEILCNMGLEEGLMLCQDVDCGTIQASIKESTDKFPCMDLQLQPKDQNEEPILIASVTKGEGPAQEGNPLKAHLFGRVDEHPMAEMPVDIRPSAEIREITENGGSISQPLAICSQHNMDVGVTFESNHYTIRGNSQ